MNAGTTNGPGQDGTADDAADSGAIGVGGVTSGQEGATPSHETQQETGGSGGEQLTASQGNGEDTAMDGQQAGAGAQPGGVSTVAPAAAPAAAPGVAPNAAEPGETSMHSGARGALDTRSGQAGGTGTGIGSPESGANQSPEDLAPPAGATNR